MEIVGKLTLWITQVVVKQTKFDDILTQILEDKLMAREGIGQINRMNSRIAPEYFDLCNEITKVLYFINS